MARDFDGALRRSGLVLCLALFTSSTSLAATPRLAPEVAFFSTAFPELLSSYRTLFNASVYCNRAPAAACGPTYALPGPVIDDMAYFLSRLTTFPTVSIAPDRVRQEKLKAPASAEAEFAALRADYESRMLEFDNEFLGHYGALLHVCKKYLEEPDKSALRLDVVREVTFVRFWGRTPRENREALGVVDSIAADAIRQLGVVPKERCMTMLELSKPLLSVLLRRLKLYSQRDCCDVSSEDRWGANMLFAWAMAVELEAHVRPDVLKEIEAREAQSKTQTAK